MISQERIDLERLAEIEIDLRTFGNLTFEQEKEKREILTKYEKKEMSAREQKEDFLEQQLVAVRKENERLKFILAEVKKMIETLQIEVNEK